MSTYPYLPEQYTLMNNIHFGDIPLLKESFSWFVVFFFIVPISLSENSPHGVLSEDATHVLCLGLHIQLTTNF